MKALKICAQVILIFLLLCLPAVANAELQGRLFGDDVVTEDGESFNVGELIKALDDGNVDKAESLYNDFYKRRQEMLKRGTEFGILDLFIKDSYAWILYAKKDYKAGILITDEVLDYLRAHLNEGNEKDSNWIYQIYNSMNLKKYNYDALKDYANSLEVQKDIVEFLSSNFNSDDPNLLNEKMKLSLCYCNINDYKTAVEVCEEFLPQFEKVYGETDENTLHNYKYIITLCYQLDDYEKMGVWLNKAVPIVEKLSDDSNIKYLILNDQATYYQSTGQFQKSTELCERLLEMPISDENKIDPLHSIANNYRMSGDYSNALKYIMQAWDIYEKNIPENKYTRKSLLEEMSLIHSKLGNYQESMKYAQESLDLSVELDGLKSHSVFDSRKVLAYCYDKMGDNDKALELSKKNYALAIELYGTDNPRYIDTIDKIAWTYYQLGDYESGITWAKKALNESIRILGEKNIQTQSLRFTLGNLYLQDKSTLDEGIRLLDIGLKEYSKLVDPQDSNIAIFMENLASGYNKAARWKDAITLYEKVLERYEDRMSNYGSLNADEKMILFADETSAYVNAAHSYYYDNNFKDAFKTFERGRSRLLIDSYAEQIVKSSGVLDKKEVAKLNEYKAELANYANLINAAFQSGDEQARFKFETEQRNLSDEYVKYKESLKNKYPKYKTISQANKIEIERDKNILPADTAFVDFMAGYTTITAFIFDNGGDIKAVQFIVPESFFETCNLYRELLSYPSLETMQQSNAFLYKFPDGSYKLTFGANIQRGSGAERVKDNETFLTLKKNLSKEIGDALLMPLAEYISKYPNLIISPDKGLNNIPFETLKFNGKPAIETFNMSYVPSFSVLKLMYEAGEKNSNLKNRQDIYAMGNPFYGDNDADAANRSLENFLRGQRGEIAVNQFRNLKWKNLPGTKEEIDRVAKIFGNKKIFTEKSASETNLKTSNQRDELAKYKYLLFSTHGLFNPNAPEYNSIVLSQGVDTKEDGYVTIGEWAGMNLNSDVVFLSACETGLGEYQAGEGIIGLPYALTIAGNKNTVMSLWEVQDKYAPEFVSTFFKKMKEGKTAFIAINETKREFLKHKDEMYRDPSVWSAFVLYGF